MDGLPPFRTIEGLADIARLRAKKRLYTGGFGMRAQAVVEFCTHALIVDDERMALVTWIRESGAQSCGWWSMPGLQRSRRLSISFRDRRTGAFLPPDPHICERLAHALFGEQVERVWCETPPLARCKPAGTWHYRLFCDARGRAAPPQDDAFTRENAGEAWRPFDLAHPKDNRHVA